jgi:hypothetical protein
MTVRTWAMDNLTTLIFESLLGAPPVTLATLKRASSAFNSFNYMIATTHPKLCSYLFENNILPDDRKNFQCNAILADLPSSDHGLRNKLPRSQKEYLKWALITIRKSIQILPSEAHKLKR